MAGRRRKDSTHMLTAVKCVGSSRSRRRVVGPPSTGMSATTIGNNRTPLRVTARAISNRAAPVVTVVIRITCAGAAHTRTVDIASHQELRPKSWVKAPMPIYVPANTNMNTDVRAVFAPAKKAAEDDEKTIGADMAGIHVSHTPPVSPTARVSATGHIRMRQVRKAKAGRGPGLANGAVFRGLKLWPMALSAL